MNCLRRWDDESGTAMVISLLFLVAMTIVGTLFVVKTKTETQISGHDTRATQALFDAEAGYAEALARMSDPFDATNYVGAPSGYWRTNPGWGIYIVDKTGDSATDPGLRATESDGLDNDGDGVTDESGERYGERLTRQGSGRLDYTWVKVHYKLNGAGQPILFGDHDNNMLTPPQANIVNGEPLLVVASEGRRGTARRRVEIEAGKNPVELPNTSLYSESDKFAFNGTAFLVSGQDYDPVTGAVVLGNPEATGILTTGDPATVAAALMSKQVNNVVGAGGSPSIARSAVDYDLQALRDQYVPEAEIILSPGTYSSCAWGGINDYKIVHATGDIHLSGGGSQGGGLLIVDGDLEVTGQFTWYGLVLVLGDIRFSGGGAEIHLYGGLFVQGAVDAQTVGGQADILYSSSALEGLSAFVPYAVLRWRELP